MGRPMFCISLRKNGGPFDFVSYSRIMAGLPAGPEKKPRADPGGGRDRCRTSDCAGPDGGPSASADPSASSSPQKSVPASGDFHDDDNRSPSSSHPSPSLPSSLSPPPPPPSPLIRQAVLPEEEGRGDQDRCRGHEHASVAENALSSPPSSLETGTTPGVHERWSALRDDPEGLRAVVDILELRLLGYGGGGGGGRSSALAGGDIGEDTDPCEDGDCGSRGDAAAATSSSSVEEAARVSSYSCGVGTHAIML